ncbi:MAG TPA: hypothetical protein VHV77_08630, partial [Pirellulales bacterium]|nr:hypothetical protein [Pirellulales bacterium]
MHRLHARLRSLYLAWFSKPAEWRLLFQHIRRHRPCRLLEIGIGTGQRACRLIEVASAASPESPVQYAGVDLFEMRAGDDGPGL